MRNGRPSGRRRRRSKRCHWGNSVFMTARGSVTLNLSTLTCSFRDGEVRSHCAGGRRQKKTCVTKFDGIWNNFRQNRDVVMSLHRRFAEASCRSLPIKCRRRSGAGIELCDALMYCVKRQNVGVCTVECQYSRQGACSGVTVTGLQEIPLQTRPSVMEDSYGSLKRK